MDEKRIATKKLLVNKIDDRFVKSNNAAFSQTIFYLQFAYGLTILMIDGAVWKCSSIYVFSTDYSHRRLAQLTSSLHSSTISNIHIQRWCSRYTCSNSNVHYLSWNLIFFYICYEKKMMNMDLTKINFIYYCVNTLANTHRLECLWSSTRKLIRSKWILGLSSRFSSVRGTVKGHNKSKCFHSYTSIVKFHGMCKDYAHRIIKPCRYWTIWCRKKIKDALMFLGIVLAEKFQFIEILVRQIIAHANTLGIYVILAQVFDSRSACSRQWTQYT